MEQTGHLQPQELAKLIRKLRWIGMEEESRHLQMAMFSLPAHERYAVFGGAIQHRLSITDRLRR